jgi:hypothetical protein
MQKLGIPAAAEIRLFGCERRRREVTDRERRAL